MECGWADYSSDLAISGLKLPIRVKIWAAKLDVGADESIKN